MNALLARRSFCVLCGVAALLGAAASVVAQEPLAKAKALYDAAAYEDALTALAAVRIPEAEQYRALCMLALGRADDATSAVELLVSSVPTFEPSVEDVPPRFVTLVSEAKKKLLPSIARKTFNEGREQFRSGDREQALKKFTLVIALTDSAGFKDTSDADDLRTLAAGFIDLASAAADSRPAPKVPEAETPKVVESAPAPIQPTEVSQPVAIRQTIPPVPSGISGVGSPTASVRVEIGADGKVINASIQQMSHPLYDRLILQAARQWLYVPATLNGKPVASEKVVSIQLR